ncbi:MAG: hypothetical protein U1E65_09705 [Myxococcota bacterium]
MAGAVSKVVRWAVVLGLALAVAPLAWAEPAWAAVEVEPRLPFDEATLADAIRARRPSWPEAVPGTVEVKAIGDDAIAVDLLGRHRVVSIAGLSKEATTRRVAMTIVDVLDGLSLAPLAAEPPPQMAPAPVVAPAPAPVLLSAPARVEPMILGVFGASAAGPSLMAGGALGVTGPLWSALRWHLEGGLLLGPSGHARGVDVSILDLSARAGLLYRLEALGLDLGLGALVLPRLVRASPSASRPELSSVSTTLVSTGAGARAALSFGKLGPLSFVASVGVDVLFSSAALAVEGTDALETERVRVWGALGLALAEAG